MNIVAYRNTWTGLRKKRREHLRFERMDRDSSNTSSTSTLNVPENNSLFSQLHNENELVQNSCMSPNSVKENENIEKKLRFVSSVSEDEVPKKRRRMSSEFENNSFEINRSEINTNENFSTLKQSAEEVIVEATLRVKNLQTDLLRYKESNVDERIPLLLQISLIQGKAEVPQQILQIIKNNLVRSTL